MRELAAFFSMRSFEPSLPEAARDLVYGVDWEEEVEARESSTSTEARPFAGYGRAVVCPGSAPARVRGLHVRNLLRAQDLSALEQWRGGWGKGRRAFHLKLFAEFLRGGAQDRTTVLRRCASWRPTVARLTPASPTIRP